MRHVLQGRAGMGVAFLLGLVVATAGTATAARLITGKQIKDGSVSAKDLSKAVRAQLKKRGPKGATGAAGAAGVPGPSGPPGPAGAAGRSALTPLGGGEVLRGTVGGKLVGTVNEEHYVVETLPIPAPEPLTDANVIVDGPYEDSQDTCRGSYANPTAPPGKLCIYGSEPGVGYNTKEQEGTAAGGFGGPATPYGFGLRFYVSAPGEAAVFATWAYTAP